MKLIHTIGLMIMPAVITCLAGESPVAVIKRINNEILQTSGNAGDKNIETMIKVTSGMFDFATLGRNVLPANVWESADSAELKDFIASFRELVEYSSAGNLSAFRQDSIQYDTPVIVDDTATVRVRLWSGGHENILQYRMNTVDGSWKVVDMVINDLSTAANYKEQFRELLKKKSLREIIDLLQKKSQSLRQKQ